MHSLEQQQLEQVGGGSLAGDIAMTAAGAWSSAVVGAGVGSVVPGVGTIAGAAAGFGLGVLIGIGYALATN